MSVSTFPRELRHRSARTACDATPSPLNGERAGVRGEIASKEDHTQCSPRILEGLPLNRRGRSVKTSLAGVVAMLVLAALMSPACRTQPTAPAAAESEIRALLSQQERDWNAGNLAAFMEGYAKSDTTRFASGGNVFYGWQTVFDRYRKKYADPAAMGATTFSDLDIKVLSPDAAIAFGRWRQKGSSGEGSGVFTLVLRKMSVGWRIIHDHTSVADTK